MCEIYMLGGYIFILKNDKIVIDNVGSLLHPLTAMNVDL